MGRVQYADTPLPKLRVFASMKAPKRYSFGRKETDGPSGKASQGNLDRYQADPLGYMRDILGVEPWEGCNGKPGQLELVQDVASSVALQLAGRPASKVFRVEAGHGVGKTYIAAAFVNWFFDSFAPSVTITTAPTIDQVELLLWKDIKTLRRGLGLPGRVLPDAPKMILAEDHWAIGRTTSDNGGKGTARVQGQHNEYWLFVLDEAEGVPEFFFKAVDGMMTGGKVGIVLMLANPQTRTSEFHKRGKKSGTKNYRLSVLDHPNVVMGSDVVPGATRRDWAAGMIADECEPVDKHDDDEYTFEVEFEIERDGTVFPAGTIWLPNAEFCFRVLGIAPANLADKVFFPPGRYEAAKTRDLPDNDGVHAQIGVDCARFGKDAGTVYRLHRAICRRDRQIRQGDTHDYWSAARDSAFAAKKDGAVSVSFRIDGTGGFGAGTIDLLKKDEELAKAFPAREVDGRTVPSLVIHEVQFGASANDGDKYANLVTEMYAQAAETLKGIRVEHVPNELEGDLTEREYGWVNREGKQLRTLIEKEKFRKAKGRSPDDGDGFVLASSPEFLFKTRKWSWDNL